ncbi:hypothetical protein MES4922_10302 [Mesorhizobium ventifaucium]|uniref:Transposase n=1 Tax=Mesorhizobium ventifaucium TaxID=666020 RepID=A0ABM9DCY2_9HYPH|nr:hypothetical protein MES4922_10302 [Mesorhizobium ventifaucium]
MHDLIVAEPQWRERVACLEKALDDTLADWSLTPVVESTCSPRGSCVGAPASHDCRGAVANKLARIIWAMIKTGELFRSSKT